MKKIQLMICIVVININSYAQNIGIGTPIPDASALLELKASDKGLLIPRTSTASRTSIVNPAKGLLVYDTTSSNFWFYNSNAWVPIDGGSTSWILTGNTGTNAATHFIGTTDDQPLTFKVNNSKIGLLNKNGNVFWGIGSGNSNTISFSNIAIGNFALYRNTNRSNLVAIGDSALFNNGIGASVPFQASYNTAVGSKSLFANTTGFSNTAVGTSTLDSNKTGAQNTAVGTAALFNNINGNNNTALAPYALYKNTSGNNNTAIGEQSLSSNTISSDNTALGYFSLGSNLTGFSNVALGVHTLHSNTSQSNLVAIGDSALYNNGTGASTPTDATGNTALGSKALYSNTTGGQNTATGFQALYKNTAGNYNTSVGHSSLFNNGTGAAVPDDASRNTAIGYYSMYDNTTGGYNTSIGFASLQKNTTGYFNSAIGYSALGNNTSGFENTAVGLGAGGTSTANQFCTFLGNRTDASTNLDNSVAIGYNAVVNASNKIRLGNSAVTVVEGAAAYTVSDGRFKQDIKENVPGIDFISSLRPVTYRYKSFELDKFILQNNQQFARSLKQSDYSQSEDMIHMGFVAQEVEELIKEKKYTLSMVKAPTNKTDNYSMAYGELIAPLVKAVQEQQKMIEDLKNENAEIKARLLLLDDLRREVNVLTQGKN